MHGFPIGAARRAQPALESGRAAKLTLAAALLLTVGCAVPARAQNAAPTKVPATAASATKPAAGAAAIAPAPTGPAEKAKSTFESFAQEWMVKMDRAAHETAKKGAGSASTLRGYGKEWTTEIKPTGSPSAPFVGLLRYIEEERACKDAALLDCSVTNTTGVTEIFRFQGGKWVY